MSDAHAAHHHTAEHDIDPHGVGHHEHVILSWQLLTGVLAALLCLTALTVFTAQTEQWIMDTWQIEIPRWINIVGAMSIATVKALLVCAFFMQLKYDKPLNSIVMLFCLFCVWLFLMFSMIDLGNRDKVIEYRAEIRTPGGTGVSLGDTLDKSLLGSAVSARLSPHVQTGNLSLPEYVAEQAITNFPDETKLKKDFEQKYLTEDYYTQNTERAFWHHYYEKTYLRAGKTPHHHERDENHYFDSFVERFHDQLAAKGLEVHHTGDDTASDANRSRPSHGLTAGLFDAHDDGHTDASHGADTHDEGGQDAGTGEQTGDGEHAATDDH